MPKQIGKLFEVNEYCNKCECGKEFCLDECLFLEERGDNQEYVDYINSLFTKDNSDKGIIAKHLKYIYFCKCGNVFIA